MADNSSTAFAHFVNQLRTNTELKITIASDMLARCESPIERQFLCSYFASAMSPQFLQILEPVADEAERSSLWHQVLIGNDFHKAELYVQRTLRVTDRIYRADFLILVPSKSIQLVVELDGHDFHEKTKEQAQRDKCRDRHLTQAGYKIFHFTGSEVFRDCNAVLKDIYNLLESFGEVAA